MNTTRLLLICLASLSALCAGFVQPLNGPLAFPQNTITFEDIPAQYMPVWDYLWYTPNVGIGQAYAAVIDTSANWWTSNATWFDQPFNPGHFYTMYGDYMDYNFNPPLQQFSVKIRATTSSVPRISVKLINGTEITGTVIAPFSYSDVNRYDYYGFNSSVPITNVLIRGGPVNVDDFQYITVCPKSNYSYNANTGQCVLGSQYAESTGCDPNAYRVVTGTSYKCQCKTNYQGDGRTCSSYFNVIHRPLEEQPQGTLTFNDIPVGDLPVWNYKWLDNANHIALGQNTAKITDGTSGNWNGALPWYDQTGTAGRFYAMTSDYTDFLFDPPIKSFSVKMNGIVGSPFIQMKLANGTFIDGIHIPILEVDSAPQKRRATYGIRGSTLKVSLGVIQSDIQVNVETGQVNPTIIAPVAPAPITVNAYAYYGYSTTYPITNVLVRGGSVNMDDFQFITMCADKNGRYDANTNTCA